MQASSRRHPRSPLSERVLEVRDSGPRGRSRLRAGCTPARQAGRSPASRSVGSRAASGASRTSPIDQSKRACSRLVMEAWRNYIGETGTRVRL